MATKEQTLNLIGVLATAAVTGIGFAVGGTVGAQVMAAIGINLSSEIIQNGYARMKESWLAGPDGVLNHDIQRALGRAFGKALVSLETKYFQLPEAAALPREERKSVSALFKSLREHAPESFMALVGEASGDAELKGYLYGEPEAATEKLFGRINATEALDGFPAHFKNFLRQNLLGELVFWFGEELKTDSKESNKAWRAFQRLLLEGIQADVRAVRDGVTEVRLNQQAIQDDLRTLDQLRAQLDQLRDTVERRLPDEMFQRVVEKAFGDVMSLLSRIDAKVDTIRRDVQLLRQEREREDDGRPSPAEFDARLSQIRRNVLSGPSPWELQQSLYQVEELGQWYQHHPELRSLQDQIKLAIARTAAPPALAYQQAAPAPRASKRGQWPYLIGVVSSLVLVMSFALVLYRSIGRRGGPVPMATPANTNANYSARPTPTPAPADLIREPETYAATYRVTTGPPEPVLVLHAARAGDSRSYSFSLPRRPGNFTFIEKAGRTYVVLAELKQYAELSPDSPAVRLPRAFTPAGVVEYLHRSRLSEDGETTLGGRRALRYNVYPAGGVSSEGVAYVDKETGLPLSVESSRTPSVSIALRDMRPLSGPSAFDIPKGYRPVSAESAERELGVLLEILRGTRDADR